MIEWLLSHEAVVRLGAFSGVFVLMAVWEVKAARRPLGISKPRRWLANLGLVVLNSIVLRLLFPTAALAMAIFASAHGWGLLNHLDIPIVVAIIAAVVLLDFAIYVQHVVFHALPNLWRLHMVHHADRDFDVTTGLRFHPIEIVLSMAIKFAVIAALGPPVAAVLIFEVLLNATAMFNHGNVRIPRVLDRLIRLVVVTPDMHRVHHSVLPLEHNSNFGFCLPWWDRVLGAYRSQPRAGHEAMAIGLTQFQEGRPQNLLQMLALPFVEKPGEHLHHDEGETV